MNFHRVSDNARKLYRSSLTTGEGGKVGGMTANVL